MDIISEVFKLLAKEYKRGANSNWTGSKVHRLIKELTGCEDPYKLQKKQSNEMALSFMDDVENILKKDDSLETCVR